MNDFFSRLFGKLHQTAAIPRHDTIISIQDESDHTTRHQLVQMLMRGELRKHGIPAHWIELQILAVPGKKQGLGMYVHLVLKQWDSRLMNHIQAFQNTLLADIKRYEPKCGEWLHGMSWKLEMGSTCPYDTLPDKPFWTAPTQAAAPMVVPVGHGPARHGRRPGGAGRHGRFSGIRFGARSAPGQDRARNRGACQAGAPVCDSRPGNDQESGL